MVPTSIDGMVQEMYKSLPFGALVRPSPCQIEQGIHQKWKVRVLLHQGHAVGRFNVLRGILSSGDEHRRHNVGGVSVEATCDNPDNMLHLLA